MEEINKFTSGMNSDVNPFMQPENTSRYSLNFVPMSADGNLYSIINEDGTTLMSDISFPTGFRVMGYSVLSKDILVILVHPSGYSQVGYITQDSDLHATYGKYHPAAPVDAFGNVPNNNSEFGFSVDHPIDCVSRKLINGHRILYFTDNNVPFGQVDLENPPDVGSVLDQVKLTFNIKVPDIQLTAIKENVASTIKPGVYQFITRYITNSGGATTFGIPCNPIPMVPTMRAQGANQYHGAFNEDGIVNKNIVLTFTNVDTQYTELEIVCIYYEGSQSVFKASIIAQLPISSNTLTYTFTGPNTEAIIDLTREELRKIPVTYDRAKCISQKDNTLFLSNLSESRSADSALLQEIANKVRVKYRITEEQFSGRGDNGQISYLVFTLVNPPVITGVNTINLLFNENVDSTSGTVLTSYVLHKTGLPAVGNITVTDYTLMVVGDTITVGAGPSQAAVILTAVASAPSMNEFVIGATNDETAQNIMNAINASTDITEYSAYVSLGVVQLVWSNNNLAANGVTIVASGSGVTTVNFAGASSTPVDVNPTAAIASDNNITLEFLNPVSTADTLSVVTSIQNEDLSQSYQTGVTSPLPIVDVVTNSQNNAFALGFTDYTNENLTFDEKSYRRGEAYSLGYFLLYKDGSNSFTYHIPGYAGYVDASAFSGGQYKFEPTGGDVWPSFDQSANSTGFLGTYVSQLEYPLNQNYPGNVTGDDLTEAGPGTTARLIRHHLMPDLENEPHFRVDANGVTFIRILGLEFEFTVPIPDNILKDVQDIVFVRERRNNQQNSSIIAQGFINREVVSADSFTDNGVVSGSDVPGGAGVFTSIKSGYMATEILFFDNGESLSFSGDGAGLGGNTGIAYPNYSGNGGDPSGYNNGLRISTQIFNDRCFFYSPETVLLTGYGFEAGTIIGSSLVPKMKMKGDYKRVSFWNDVWVYDVDGVQGRDWLNAYMYADFYGDFNNYELASSGTARTITFARNAEGGKYRLPALDPINSNLLTSTRWCTGGLELKLDGDLVHPGGSKFIPRQEVKLRNPPGICVDDCSGSYWVGGIGDSAGGDTGGAFVDRLRRYLYNIELNNTTQYGQLSLASYIPIHKTSPFDNVGDFKTTYLNVYGGDTFITKFSVNTGNLLNYWPYKRHGDNIENAPNRSHSARGYGQIDGISLGGDPGLASGWDFRCCNYYFVESNINTYYRHKPVAEQRQDYYPNQANLTSLLNNFFPYLENQSAYNSQYSYENNVREYFTKGSVQEVVSSFENRTIFSEKAENDDILDSYRSFLQNSFYDLPSNTGPIWDSFVEFNRLFLHTPKSLWMTFAEPAATLEGGNIGDVVLGTGDLFARPSQEILTTEGGYAGTISQFGGTHTPMGYIFPDLLQGKIFNLAVGEGGPFLRELSESGLQTFMHKNLGDGIISLNGIVDLTNVTTNNSHLIDNPYSNIGLNGGYDYKLKRYFLIKHGENPFTLTYSNMLQKWVSFHSYSPNLVLPFDNQVFFFRNFNEAGSPITIQMWEMNTGSKGTYFGTTYDSILEYACAPNKRDEKMWGNLIIDSVSTNKTTGVRVRDNNFNILQCFTNKQNSGEYQLIHGNDFNPSKVAGQTFIKYRKGEYRVAIPRDSVIDNSQDIFAPSNLNNTAAIRERLKGDFLIVRLTYNNTPDIEFVINYISTIFNINIR